MINDFFKLRYFEKKMLKIVTLFTCNRNFIVKYCYPSHQHIFQL